jgi:hypothetical protein
MNSNGVNEVLHTRHVDILRGLIGHVVVDVHGDFIVGSARQKHTTTESSVETCFHHIGTRRARDIHRDCIGAQGHQILPWQRVLFW